MASESVENSIRDALHERARKTCRDLVSALRKDGWEVQTSPARISHSGQVIAVPKEVNGVFTYFEVKPRYRMQTLVKDQLQIGFGDMEWKKTFPEPKKGFDVTKIKNALVEGVEHQRKKDEMRELKRSRGRDARKLADQIRQKWQWILGDCDTCFFSYNDALSFDGKRVPIRIKLSVEEAEVVARVLRDMRKEE